MLIHLWFTVLIIIYLAIYTAKSWDETKALVYIIVLWYFLGAIGFFLASRIKARC